MEDPGRSSTRIQVLVGDGSRMGSQLLADAVKRDQRLQVVRSTFGSAAFLQAIARERVDVALMSADLDENSSRSGFQALRDLSVARPEIRAVILLGGSSREDVVEAFRSGAKGVLCRSQSLRVLCRCIRCVHAGQIWVSSEELELVLKALTSISRVRLTGMENAHLTRREQDVVRCVAEGLSNREIGQRLRLSDHTVKNYVFRIFEKLGVSSRVELLFSVLGSSTISDQSPDTRSATSDPIWLKKAAEQGCPAAQASLAKMYLSGDGLPRDQIISYMWLSLAERTSNDVLGDCIKVRKQLAAQLTADQVSEAERRALDWIEHAKQGIRLSPPNMLPPGPNQPAHVGRRTLPSRSLGLSR